MRYVLIDFLEETATPFDTESDAQNEVVKILESGGHLPEDFDLNDVSIYNKPSKSDVDMVIQEEGKEGVWTGFSSADRCCICGEYPPAEGEWMGNGDINVYITVGVPSGTKVVPAREE